MHTEDLDNMHELQQINAALPEVYTGIMEQIESRLPEILALTDEAAGEYDVIDNVLWP